MILMPFSFELPLTAALTHSVEVELTSSLLLTVCYMCGGARGARGHVTTRVYGSPTFVGLLPSPPELCFYTWRGMHD